MFYIKRENAHILINVLGLKIRFKNPLINQLSDCCAIVNLDYLKKQNTVFPHPIGITIAKNAILGKNCVIFQNVTIGSWKSKAPIIGDNVTIYPNTVLFGDIKIGNNVTIGPGAVVYKSIPDNSTVLGGSFELANKITDIQKEDYND